MNKSRLGVIMLALTLGLTACSGSSSNSSASYQAVQSSSLAADYNMSGNTDGFEAGAGVVTDMTEVDGLFQEYNEPSLMGSSNSKSSSQNETAMRPGTEKVEVEQSDVDVATQQNKKLIRTVDMAVRIPHSDQLSETVAGLIDLAESFGGWSALNQTNFGTANAHGELVLKIPNTKVDAFLDTIKANGLKITSINDNSTDVTLQYSDTETQLRIKEIEKEKYMQYLESAQTIEEILAIEERLDNVINEIESHSSKLRTLDSQIDYTSVGILITCEVSEETLTLGDEIKERLSEIGENAVDLLLGGLEFAINSVLSLVFSLPIIFGVIFLTIKVIKVAAFGSDKEKRKKKEKKMPEMKKEAGIKEKVAEQVDKKSDNSEKEETNKDK